MYFGRFFLDYKERNTTLQFAIHYVPYMKIEWHSCSIQWHAWPLPLFFLCLFNLTAVQYSDRNNQSLYWHINGNLRKRNILTLLKNDIENLTKDLTSMPENSKCYPVFIVYFKDAHDSLVLNERLNILFMNCTILVKCPL